MIFIRPGAAGIRGGLGAALRRAVGAKKIIRSSVFELLGPMFFLRPRAAGTRDAPRAVLHREAGVRAHETRADPGAVLSR
jgi:hypothetical protein